MFDRLERLVGIDNLNKIKNIKVAVVGLGGVGGYAVESLVRAGINTIILADYDKIDLSNLNRQIISNQKNIGLKKVEEFEKRIKLINENIKVIKIDKFLDEENINILFDNEIDFVIDACDTVKTKISIIKQCLNRKIKFISSMGTGNRMDPTKLMISDIKKTSYDPLAKKVRKMLKEEHIVGKIPVVFSLEQPIKSKIIGSNSFVPATAGLLCTSYVINEVIKYDR